MAKNEFSNIGESMQKQFGMYKDTASTPKKETAIAAEAPVRVQPEEQKKRGRKPSKNMPASVAERNDYIKAAVTEDFKDEVKIYCIRHKMTVEELIYTLVKRELDKNK